MDSQKLQQFIANSPWPEQPVWQAIRQEVIPVVEPLQAWVVDETGWLKQGGDSVGVSKQAPQGQTQRQLAEGFMAGQWQAASWRAADGENRATRLAWRQIYLNSDLDEQNGQ